MRYLRSQEFCCDLKTGVNAGRAIELCNNIFPKRSSIRHDSSMVLLPNNEQVLINPNQSEKA